MDQTRVTGTQTIAVVLPCYKSKEHVLDVIARIGPETSLIVAVDDACPMEPARTSSRTAAIRASPSCATRPISASAAP